jgi:hypothetical protein
VVTCLRAISERRLIRKPLKKFKPTTDMKELQEVTDDDFYQSQLSQVALSLVYTNSQNRSNFTIRPSMEIPPSFFRIAKIGPILAVTVNRL